MGESHTVEQLSQILADPALSEWQTRAEKAKSEGWYWKYEHPEVEILSVETSNSTSEVDPTDPDASAFPDASPTDSSPTDSSPSANSSPSLSSSSPESSPSPESSSTPESSTSSTPESSTSSSPDSSTDSSSASSTTPAAGDAERAQVEARVTEKADLYTNGQLDNSSSYESTLRVQYNLTRQQGQWRIESMEVLE
jgi:hypothetical protein